MAAMLPLQLVHASVAAPGIYFTGPVHPVSPCTPCVIQALFSFNRISLVQSDMATMDFPAQGIPKEFVRFLGNLLNSLGIPYDSHVTVQATYGVLVDSHVLEVRSRAYFKIKYVCTRVTLSSV